MRGSRPEHVCPLRRVIHNRDGRPVRPLRPQVSWPRVRSVKAATEGYSYQRSRGMAGKKDAMELLHSGASALLLVGLLAGGVLAAPAHGWEARPKSGDPMAQALDPKPAKEETRPTPAALPAERLEPVRVQSCTCPRCRGCRPRAVIIDGERFEPSLRDLRLVPRRALPGDDFGRRETLPVLPAQRGGWFVLPTY